MSASGIILLLAFLALALVGILWPLFAKAAEDDTGSEGQAVAELKARREGILRSIRDVEFDYQTGKISQEDFTAQREKLMQAGVAILKEIDARESELIEAVVEARRTAPKSKGKISARPRPSARK